MKIIPVGAEMFHEDRRTDRRTDVTKLIVAFFYKFAIAPKNATRKGRYKTGVRKNYQQM